MHTTHIGGLWALRGVYSSCLRNIPRGWVDWADTCPPSIVNSALQVQIKAKWVQTRAAAVQRRPWHLEGVETALPGSRSDA